MATAAAPVPSRYENLSSSLLEASLCFASELSELAIGRYDDIRKYSSSRKNYVVVSEETHLNYAGQVFNKGLGRQVVK